MKLFLEEFAPGYTTSQLDAFNTEWEARAEELKLEEYSDHLWLELYGNQSSCELEHEEF